MLLIIYILAWFIVAAAGALYLTGSFNEMTLTFIGFLVSTLFFMSIVGVLPWRISQPYSPKR